MEEKSNASVNKRLYKLLIIILRYTPVVLSINDILHSILSYYNINCYILSCLGGVSLAFLGILYIISYVFRFCYLYRIPLYFVTLTNLIALYDLYVGINIGDLQMLRVYLVLFGISMISFIYLKVKKKCWSLNKNFVTEIHESKFEHLSDCAEQIVKHGKKLMHCLSELESKSGEHYMERYGKRRRGGMRDSDYDDEDYPRYYWYESSFGYVWRYAKVYA